MADEIRMKVEVREDEARLGPGRLYGVVMVYNKRASDRPELFERGSLSWPESGIVLNRQHSRKSPIMRVTPTVEGDEVRIGLSGYLFDQPNAGRGSTYANALRNSGAAAILMPYRVHRAGSVAIT